MAQTVVLGDDDRSARLRSRVYAEVLRPSFTETELVDQEAVAPIDGRFVVCSVGPPGDEEVLAAGVSDCDLLSGVTLLSYLAARPGGRGRGHGAALLAELRRLWRDAGAGVVLAEVHDPRVWPERHDEHPVDRLRFYARNGCQLLSAPWVQPALGPGGREPGMLLLVVDGAAIGDTLEQGGLLAWMDRYYAECEGARPTDAQFVALRSAFSDRAPTVGPIDNLDAVTPLRG